MSTAGVDDAGAAAGGVAAGVVVDDGSVALGPLVVGGVVAGAVTAAESVDAPACAVSTTTSPEPVCRPAIARIVADPARMPITTPVGETVAIVVSLDSQRATAPMLPITGRPVRSTMLEANLILDPISTVAEVGSTSTDAAGGNTYAADVRSVTSAPFLFASVPPQAAAARISAMSTDLVLKFTV